MYLNLTEMPFSRYGSYFALSHLSGVRVTDTLYLRSVHSQERMRSLFAVTLLQGGAEVPFTEEATPALLTLRARHSAASCEIAFDGPSILRVRASGCALRLYMEPDADYQLAYPAADGRWEINAYSHKLMVSPLEGLLRVAAPWEVTKCAFIELILNADERETGEFALEEYRNVWPCTAYTRPFSECVADAREDYERFLARTLPVPERYAGTRELAAYLNWSAVVAPVGYLKRNAMLMSKKWMSSVWSWDHCFNAMALAAGDPALAMDQILVPFDLQDETGSLPDCVGDEGIIRNFVKPPVHGIALRHMAELSAESLQAVYEPLRRWTDWWFTYRDFDGDGIPQYHHGNDSGWDNATTFMDTPVVEGADLSAFLVLQLETLADIAHRLGKAAEAQTHRDRAKTLLRRLLEHFAVDGQLRSCASGTHARAKGDSLFEFLPLVLGHRLPPDIRANMIAALKEEGRFLTENGFATESVRSPYYRPDGYWRGPIWAPSTWLLVLGLRECGETALAERVSRAFCDMCARHGFAENFDALTGEGLRDKAYTWTSSVFLLLANGLLKGDGEQ